MSLNTTTSNKGNGRKVLVKTLSFSNSQSFFLNLLAYINKRETSDSIRILSINKKMRAGGATSNSLHQLFD